MGGNGSCSCSDKPSEMTAISAEEAAKFQESATGHCIADAFVVTTTFNALEPVAVPSDCNQVMITFVIIGSGQGNVYLLGSHTPEGPWTLAANYNFNTSGYVALTPPSSGFGFPYLKPIVVSSATQFIIGNLCIWCTHG